MKSKLMVSLGAGLLATFISSGAFAAPAAVGLPIVGSLLGGTGAAGGGLPIVGALLVRPAGGGLPVLGGLLGGNHAASGGLPILGGLLAGHHAAGGGLPILSGLLAGHHAAGGGLPMLGGLPSGNVAAGGGTPAVSGIPGLLVPILSIGVKLAAIPPVPTLLDTVVALIGTGGNFVTLIPTLTGGLTSMQSVGMAPLPGLSMLPTGGSLGL